MLVSWATLIGSIKGVENLYVEPITGLPQIIIKYNRALLAKYHLSIANINKVINTAFAGQSAGLIFEEEKRFDLVVRLNANERENLEDVQNLLIPTDQGIQIPLSQLASVEKKDGPNQIQREDAKRRIVVGFNVKGRDVQSIVHELQSKVEKQLKFPTGYYVTYGGSFENLNQAKTRLMIAVPVSLLLIFVLLFFAFKSVKQGLLIYSAIPLSAIGGILFLALRGMPFSISAGVGFIALFGVAVLNGIVLLAEFNRLKNKGVHNLAYIVLKGTKSRLRPVLMTAFVASLGFLPMALSNGAGAEVQRPLATVVIGGLLVASFLTLFVLPLLYLLSEAGFKMPTVVNKKSAMAILFILFSLNALPQQKISLEDALKLAIQNNTQLKNEKLKANYAKALIKSSADIPKTILSGEYGQINSAYYDTKFGISQSFAFPTVYKRQKDLLTQEWNTTLLNTSLKEYELKKAVTTLFYSILYLKEKQNLLVIADTLYATFYQKANLRLQKGETSILEQVTANSQHAAITIQLKQLQQAIDISYLEFQLLLNTSDKLEPIATSNKLSVSLTLDSNAINNNLKIKLIQQQQNNVIAQTALEKSKLLPDLTVGYTNVSFIGVGADNNQYSASNRFNAVQIGVGIPVFAKSQRTKILASKLQEQRIQNQVQSELLSLKNQRDKLLIAYTSNLEIVSFFEKNELKNADIITKTAAKQFINGEINYLDFVMLTNQSITIRNNYLEAVKNLNETILSINFFTLNN